ncbi:MAG: AMP-binding protein [Bdellovibrionales bacterium]|nr:AMP-binding protein [Bdellovibrionales bacterium]
MQPIWLEHYPQGISPTINPDQYANIAEMFDISCKKFSSTVAYSNMGANLTYKELHSRAESFAAFLQSRGLVAGDRIAIQMPNLLQYPVVLFGALKAGLIVVNTNPLYTAKEMQHQFSDSGIKAIVILENFADKLETVLKENKIPTIITTQIGDFLPPLKKHLVNFVVKKIKKMVPPFHIPSATPLLETLKIGSQLTFSPVSMKIADIAFLQYTGGTTGVSKGAMLTHRNILSNMEMIYSWISKTLKENEETIVTALPLYHIFSLTVNCLAFTKLGGTNLLITNPKDIPGFVSTLRKERFTVFTGVNTLFNALMNHPDFTSIDFSNLKVSVAGGMALQQSVAERWKKLTKTPIAEGFGLTETSPVVACNPIDGTEKVGTIGPPLPSTDVLLIDDEGNEVSLGDRGELCIAGPQVMAGYWNRPEETAQSMIDGKWLKTGDIATIDEHGYLKIVDRKKDMILVSGFNVFPNEVEDAIAKHPDVLEVAAIGLPDEKSGEIVKVFVVPKKQDLTAEEIIEFSKQDLVAYKRPKYVEFRKELPKTNVGKILRRALKEESA